MEFLDQIACCFHGSASSEEVVVEKYDVVLIDGIFVDFGDRFGIQKLPASYCRNRYYSGVDPIVELNL